MDHEKEDVIGGAWLAQRYAIALASQLPVVSSIGKRRTTREINGRRFETFAEGSCPADSLRGHVTK